MLLWATFDQNSVIVRVKILDSAVTTGAGKTGLTNASAGLIISTIADSEATATAYTAAASNIETITTLGTYAAPTVGKCRFKEVDATNHPGVYELQFADARFSVAGAKSLLISVSGAANAAQCDAVIPLTTVDLFNATSAGLTTLDAAVSSRLAPTVVGRTLDIATTGEAGLDFDNIKDATIAHALTNIRIPNITLADTLTTYTGNTPQTGDSFARLGAPVGASISADVAGVQSDTNDIQTRLPAALAAGGHMKSDVLAVDGQTAEATTLQKSLNVMYRGSVTGAASTTTLIDSGLTQAAIDFWKGRIVIFLTGALKYQATDITAFDPATDKITFTILTNAPAPTDTYIIV